MLVIIPCFHSQWGVMKGGAVKEPPPLGQQAARTHPTGMHSCSVCYKNI